jgi:FkbM family methyltransferase
LANHRLTQVVAGSGQDVAWARIPGRYEVAAPLDDYVGRSVYFTGELDRKITWICKRLVRPGDIVLDIGANLGLVTFILAALVGPSGRVETFEPIPAMQDLLEQAVTRNGIRHVHLHKVALGSAAGELTLFVPRGHAGSATFVSARRMANSDEITVPVRTLSETLRDRDGPVRLIKIDVEGFEPEVLAGAKDYFARGRPDAVLFELNGRADEDRYRALRILDGYGYDFLAIPRCVFWMRLHRFDHRSNGDLMPGHDLLAVRRGSTYDEIAKRMRCA